MNCDEVRGRLLEFADRELDEPTAAACRAHLADCAACTRELARHERVWQLLGTLDRDEPGVGGERLAEMAATALRRAGESPASDDAPAPVLRLAPRWRRVAAAAAIVATVTLGTLGARFAMRRTSVAPAPPSIDLPDCFDDPEFVKNFDVIRDLPDLDADGDLLDVDDDVLILQALEGV
jgi:anti-sigma factor RsiW